MGAYQELSKILGLESQPVNLNFFQVSLRGVIVFVSAVIMLRLANKRFLSKMTSLDAILGFLLASLLARAVNGSAAFFPTLGAGFILVGLHRLFTNLAFRSERFGNLVKGREDILVKKGQLNSEAMKANKISQKDLLEELRLNGQV